MASILVPYFIITEYLPAISFAYTVVTFQRHFTKNFDERIRELRRQRILAREQRRLMREREERRLEDEYEERQPELRNTMRNLLAEAYPDVDQQDPFLLDGNERDGVGFRVGDDIFDDYGDHFNNNADEEIPIEDDAQMMVQNNEDN